MTVYNVSEDWLKAKQQAAKTTTNNLLQEINRIEDERIALVGKKNEIEKKLEELEELAAKTDKQYQLANGSWSMINDIVFEIENSH